MGFVTLEKSERKELFVQKNRSKQQLQMALNANAKQQLILREVITQLKAEGDIAGAEKGRQMWLQLKEQHTKLEGLKRKARR
tara:strand:- start:608 stop:853 length:246 start_codon:yes stop_codon:yes gene_type:complete